MTKWERVRDVIRERLVQGDFRRAPKTDQYLADNVRDGRVACVDHLARLLRYCRCPERVGATIIAAFGRHADSAPLPVLHTRETAINGRLNDYQTRDLTGELQLPDYPEYIDAAWEQAEESRELAVSLERAYLARIGVSPLTERVS